MRWRTPDRFPNAVCVCGMALDSTSERVRDGEVGARCYGKRARAVIPRTMRTAKAKTRQNIVVQRTNTKHTRTTTQLPQEEQANTRMQTADD